MFLGKNELSWVDTSGPPALPPPSLSPSLPPYSLFTPRGLVTGSEAAAGWVVARPNKPKEMHCLEWSGAHPTPTFMGGEGQNKPPSHRGAGRGGEGGISALAKL